MMKTFVMAAVAGLLLAGCSSPEQAEIDVAESEATASQEASEPTAEPKDDAGAGESEEIAESATEDDSPVAQLIRDDQRELTAEAYGYYQPLLDNSVGVCAELSEQELADYAMVAKRSVNSAGLDVDNDWYLAVFAESLGPDGWFPEGEDCTVFARNLSRTPSNAETLMIRDGRYSPESAYYYQMNLEDAAGRCADSDQDELADLSLSAVDELQGSGLFRDTQNNLIDGLWLIFQIIGESDDNGGQAVDCPQFAEELVTSELS